MARRSWFGLVGLVALALAASTGPSVAAGDPLGTPVAARPATHGPGVVTPAATSSWPMAGRDGANTRSNPDERLVGPATVGALTQKWHVTLGGTVAATPAVAGGTVYVPDSGGTLTALAASTGAKRWSRSVSTYTGVAKDATRATPAVAGGRLFFGTRLPGTKGVQLVAVATADGAKLWSTVVDPSPLAKITAAPTVVAGVAYVGVSSNDENSKACCAWRGSVVALDAATGKVLWRAMTVPRGYTGGSVWSSSPAVDQAAGLLYVTTGNNYSAPPGVCTQPGQTACTPADPRNHADSILALRTADGSVAWSLRTLDGDVSSAACKDAARCGPDFDFGSGANLFTATVGGVSRTMVGAGQKSGIYWAADATTGALLWSTRVGPGGTIGGIQWGTAADGHGVYVAETNAQRAPYALQPSGDPVSGGSFTALDPATGRIRWQTPDPQSARDFGFVSTANGVVYGGSDAVTGPNMYALDAATGKLLWTFDSGGSVMGGAAVVDGRVFWASGYYTKTCPPSQPACTTTNVLHAFAVPSGSKPPKAPVMVGTTHDDTARTATISWAPPASDGGSAVTGYRVLRDGTDSQGHRAFWKVLPATARSFTFGSLNPWDAYHLQVQAVNAIATGAPGTASVTVTAATPSAPTAALAARGNASATLTWAAPVHPGSSPVTGYRIRRYSPGSTTAQAPVTVAATAHRLVVKGLVNGTGYSFDVTATNGSGAGRVSAPSPVTVPATVPGAPVIGTASPGTAGGAVTATATWSAPASTGGSALTGYRVSALRLDAAGTVLATTLSAVQPPTARSLTMTLPVAGSYRFTVAALNSVGSGAGSGRSNPVAGR